MGGGRAGPRGTLRGWLVVAWCHIYIYIITFCANCEVALYSLYRRTCIYISCNTHCLQAHRHTCHCVHTKLMYVHVQYTCMHMHTHKCLHTSTPDLHPHKLNTASYVKDVAKDLITIVCG